jgi:outer membrane protein assembly factor BamB
MKFSTTKTKATAISFVLVLTITISLTFLPTINAEVTTTTSYIYCSVSNRIIGVNQQQLLVLWTADMPPDIGEQAGLVPGGRAAWYDTGFYVTDPEGNTETITIAKTDPVGSGWTIYTPDKVGTYTVQAFFPAIWKNTTVTQAFYSEDVSPEVTFTVQEEPIPGWPESPVTEDYWTRPISSAARDWNVLAGNWLGGSANVWPPGSSGGNIANFGYGSAPESAHILWTKPFFIGGVMDERFGAINFQTSHYQGVSWTPSIILDGKIHYTPRYTTHGDQGWAILDMYTGETLSIDYDATIPAYGQIYLYESPNQHGGFAYLWRTSNVELPEIVQIPQAEQDEDLNVIKVGDSITVNRTETPLSLGTVWEMIDAYTMETICYIANVSSIAGGGGDWMAMFFGGGGTTVYGKDGSLTGYGIVGTPNPMGPFFSDVPPYYLQVWNSSAGTMVASQTGTGAWQWRPAGGHFGASDVYLGSGDFMAPTLAYNYVHDGNDFFTLNVSIPSIEGPRNPLENQTGTIRCVREGEYVIIGTEGRNDYRGVVPGWMMAVSLEPGQEGEKLWETTFTPPYVAMEENITAAVMFTGGFTMDGVYPEENVFTFSEVKQLKRWVYDLTTGEQLWESDPEPQMSFYGMSQIVMDGKLIGYGSYAGTLIAYNITTGEILWTYEATNIGSESPYGNYPMNIGSVSDGKIYTYTSEHSFTHPLYRGPNLRCINATDGTEIWSILDFGGGGYTGLAIADGRIFSGNSMDNQIYCYGRGPSATTVYIEDDVVIRGNKVLVKGTVTDDTPTGRRNTNDIIDFTLQGTPAISDEDMSAWMEYMFMQQEKPKDAKGVEVVITTLDPNGNTYELGRTTSDINGEFGCVVEPPVPGKYQIIATFEGSKAYGPSSASTYLWVEEAPSPAQQMKLELPEEPEPTEPAEAPFITTETALIVAVVVAAVIGVAAYWQLRKRK